jgi:hypothetical protein
MVEFLVHILNLILYIMCLFESSLRSSVIFKTRRVLWHFSYQYLWIQLLKSYEPLKELPCFSIFLVFLCCNVHTCWDGYLFWFYMEVFLVMRRLEGSVPSTVQKELKTVYHKSNNAKANQV